MVHSNKDVGLCYWKDGIFPFQPVMFQNAMNWGWGLIGTGMDSYGMVTFWWWNPPAMPPLPGKAIFLWSSPPLSLSKALWRPYFFGNDAIRGVALDTHDGSHRNYFVSWVLILTVICPCRLIEICPSYITTNGLQTETCSLQCFPKIARKQRKTTQRKSEVRLLAYRKSSPILENQTSMTQPPKHLLTNHPSCKWSTAVQQQWQIPLLVVIRSYDNMRSMLWATCRPVILLFN